MADKKLITSEEFANLRCQSGTSSLKSQIGISNWDFKLGRSTNGAYASTEQGVTILSSVLHSTRAIQVNIEIMRAFVRLRQMLSSNAELWIKQLVKLLAIPLSNQMTVAKWLVIAIRLGCQSPQPSCWLPRKLAALEKKYDIQFKAVFVAIRELMTPLEPRKKRPISFARWEKK